jgi:hypothetical protein
MAVPPEVRGALLARRVDGEDVLRRLTVPVLVTQGCQDEVVLPSMAEHILGVCPTVVASWYDGVGHMPFLEDAERFNRELGESWTGRAGEHGPPLLGHGGRPGSPWPPGQPRHCRRRPHLLGCPGWGVHPMCAGPCRGHPPPVGHSAMRRKL